MQIPNALAPLFRRRPPIQFYNTRSCLKDIFTLPSPAKKIRMYNCGPTVYGRQHIGNLSMFVFTDVLRRTLEWNGYSVDQVINITDVGHLQSDADAGEDKMTLGLQREGLPLTLESMRAMAERYATAFFVDLSALNIDITRIRFPRASDYIAADIAMIRTLEEKGYAYRAAGGVYYDTSRFHAYGQLGNIDLSGLKEGARVAASGDKHHATDFLLWKSDEKLGWDSPWGKGFPGWHIECSAMIRSTLGRQIDIHTGGIEHIPIHHNNEIAQSEVATGRSPLARFWMHRAHVQIEGGKIAKSQGNVVYLSDIRERGYHPISLRYFFLQAHYRSPSNFSWEALDAAQNAYAHLLGIVCSLSENAGPTRVPRSWIWKFAERINDDLDTPGALAVLWNMARDKRLRADRVRATLLEMDKVLGLNLSAPDEDALRLMRLPLPRGDLPKEALQLFEEREQARTSKDWARADELRLQLSQLGYVLEDSGGETRIYKIGKALIS